jgi:hypothetical protein
MHTTLRLLPRFLLLAVAAACQSGAEPGPVPSMPMGETAAAAETGVDVAVQHPITHVWADARGQLRSATFRFTYRTRSAHAVLAAECVRSHWQDAIDGSLRVLQRSDATSEQGRKDCDRDLQAQLTETLFPCDAGEPLATVREIVWDKRPG